MLKVFGFLGRLALAALVDIASGAWILHGGFPDMLAMMVVGFIPALCVDYFFFRGPWTKVLDWIEVMLGGKAA